MNENSWTPDSWVDSALGIVQLARWRYDLRLAGPRALLGPPLMLVVVGALALLISLQSPRSVNSILSFGLDLMPLVAGIVAAGVLAEDDALELQLTLPTPYRQTALRRLALVLAWPSFLALVGTLILATARRLVWPVPPAADPLSDQLIWIAPLLSLAGVGVAATLGLRTMAAGSGAVGLLWMLSEILAGFFDEAPWRRALWLFYRYQATSAGAWYLNRVILIGVAILFLVLAFWILGRAEYLLKEER